MNIKIKASDYKLEETIESLLLLLLLLNHIECNGITDYEILHKI